MQPATLYAAFLEKHSQLRFYNRVFTLLVRALGMGGPEKPSCIRMQSRTASAGLELY